MEDKKSIYEEHRRKRNGAFPILLCGAVLIILLITVATAASKRPPVQTGPGSGAQSAKEDNTPEGDKPNLAVIKDINNSDKTMTLIDMDDREEITAAYTGGTEIYDKYEQVIAVSQLTLGEIVDANYSDQNTKITRLAISNRAWEYKGVNNWSVDPINRIFLIGSTKYQYPQNLVAVSQGELTDVNNLDEKDELTFKGFDKEIWSVSVTKGHGTIQLVDYKDFIGGTAYIGNDDILPVTEAMTITVQEGSYDVTLENGSLTGTKHAVVGPNQNVALNMGEFKKPVKQTGLVSFKISPAGAELFIDDKEQSYQEAVKLEYGVHSIKVALGGYTTYSGELEVDTASKTMTIGLVEYQEKEEGEKGTDSGTPTGGSSVPGGNAGTVTIPPQKPDQTEEEDDNTGEQETGEDSDSNYVNIASPEGASVYFEGADYKGEVPVSFPKKTGTYHITLIKKGYVTATYTVEFKDDGQDVTLRYDMSRME